MAQPLAEADLLQQRLRRLRGTLAVAGAASAGECVAGAPPQLPGALILTCLVSGPGKVTLRVCNVSGRAIDPPPLSYSVRVFNP